MDIDAWMTSVGCQTSVSGNGKYLMEIHDLQNIVAKLRVAVPDATELSCAKAIAFFKPGLCCHCLVRIRVLHKQRLLSNGFEYSILSYRLYSVDLHPTIQACGVQLKALISHTKLL